jgi:hypothetical protein
VIRVESARLACSLSRWMSTSACDQFTTTDTAGGWSNALNTDHPRQRDHQLAVIVEIELAEARGLARVGVRGRPFLEVQLELRAAGCRAAVAPQPVAQ